MHFKHKVKKIFLHFPDGCKGKFSGFFIQVYPLTELLLFFPENLSVNCKIFKQLFLNNHENFIGITFFNKFFLEFNVYYKSKNPKVYNPFRENNIMKKLLFLSFFVFFSTPGYAVTISFPEGYSPWETLSRETNENEEEGGEEEVAISHYGQSDKEVQAKKDCIIYPYGYSSEEIQAREVRKVVLREVLEQLQKAMEEAKPFRESEDFDKALEILSKPMDEANQKLREVMSGETFSDEEEEELREKIQEIADENIKIIAEKEEKEINDLIETWGESFIRESLHKVHFNLKLAVFHSDFYIACLEKDDRWFQKLVDKVFYDDLWFEERRRRVLPKDESAFSFTSKTSCRVRVNLWRRRLKEQYPLMRVYMAASDYENLGEEYTRLSQRNVKGLHPPDEKLSFREQVRRDFANNQHYELNKYTSHDYFGLVTPPPFTREEVMLAEQLFDKNKRAMDILQETGRLPEELRKDPEVVCADPELSIWREFLLMGKQFLGMGKSYMAGDHRPKRRCETEEEPDTEPILDFSDSSNEPTIGELRDCFRDKYKELLIGSQKEGKHGLGILGYITSADPTDEELAEGVKKIRKNAVKLLRNFRRRHFVKDKTGRYSLKEEFIVKSVRRKRNFSFHANVDLFQFLSGRLKNDYDGYPQTEGAGKEEDIRDFLIGNPHINIKPGATRDEIKELLGLGSILYEEKMERRMWFEIGGMVGWGLGCMALIRGLLSRGVCELPIGLFGNIYFFVIDTQNYLESTRLAFYRPDGARPTYQDMSELDNLFFAAALSTVLLPFFTGIPEIIKGIKLTKKAAPSSAWSNGKWWYEHDTALGHEGSNIMQNASTIRQQLQGNSHPWTRFTRNMKKSMEKSVEKVNLSPWTKLMGNMKNSMKKIWDFISGGSTGNPHAVSAIEELASRSNRNPPSSNLNETLPPPDTEQKLLPPPDPNRRPPSPD